MAKVGIEKLDAGAYIISIYTLDFNHRIAFKLAPDEFPGHDHDRIALALACRMGAAVKFGFEIGIGTERGDPGIAETYFTKLAEESLAWEDRTVRRASAERNREQYSYPHVLKWIVSHDENRTDRIPSYYAVSAPLQE